MTFGFARNNPAETSFQFLEDIACAYWYSEVLFTALELSIFTHLEGGICRANALADASGCREEALRRLLTAMERIGLICRHDDDWFNSQVASLYLVRGKNDYMGDFFLYRKYMRPKWDQLTERLCREKRPQEPEPSYADRNFRYVAAMNTLVRKKAPEIAALLAEETGCRSMIDIGGGAGSLIRSLQTFLPLESALLFDIPEVIDAAKRLYPDRSDWENIGLQGGDFRSHPFETTYDLVVMSNFLHAYGREEAEAVFRKAAALVSDKGILLIHDYFPDRKGAVPQKGALYDLAMMLNTYNGVCHTAARARQWCEDEGFAVISVNDLSTDTSVILAKRDGAFSVVADPMMDAAERIGFFDIRPIRTAAVVTGVWVREKCRFGCERFGRGLQCPPLGMELEKTRAMLREFSRGYILRGSPPGKSFHTMLLAIEREAFLGGFHKAFVFGAGPCTLCTECPDDRKCRFPHLARPSMEGAGIDVYETVRNAGIELEPVMEKGYYVSYFGLLLVE